MIRSMTGYGASKGKAGGFSVSLELRSVNNRYLDLNIRTPRGFLFAEEAIKSCIQERISRGKLDIFLSLDNTEAERIQVCVNEELASSYRSAILMLSERQQIPFSLTATELARFPEVLSLEKEEVDQYGFLEELKPLIDSAISDYNTMREREGEKLCEDLLEKANRIETLVGEIAAKAPATMSAYRERLESKVFEILKEPGIAEDRILAECAVYADRIATDEEIVRLQSHLSQFRKMLSEGSPIGRKLDFLVQEFNREANTIASKCQDSSIAYLAVEIKAEIEKIREQIQNIE